MLNECFRCGVSGDMVNLHNAISNKGIVKICEHCASIEHFPIIKKPVENQAIPQRQVSVKDRLDRMNRASAVQEINLRELIDKNLKTKRMQNYPDLIDNFHWTIQRIRRARKITREQFSKGICEPESNVRMIEQGILPGNDYKIINKIESYMGVALRKPGTSGFPNTDVQKRYVLDNSLITERELQKKMNFDAPTTKQLKISDLREMKKKYKEENGQENKPVNSWEEEYSQDDEQFLDEQEQFEEEE